MAKRSVSHKACTLTATADTADLVDSSYPAMLQGASSTQRTAVSEVAMSGQAAASSVIIGLLARDSQVATGSNTRDATQNDGALDPATAALAAPVVTGNKNATLKPRRDTALTLLDIGINAFGGVYRWQAAPGSEVFMVGNAASLGEMSLSAFTGSGTGPVSAHVIYETA